MEIGRVECGAEVSDGPKMTRSQYPPQRYGLYGRKDQREVGLNGFSVKINVPDTIYTSV
jgi:hypothetical protein